MFCCPYGIVGYIRFKYASLSGEYTYEEIFYCQLGDKRNPWRWYCYGCWGITQFAGLLHFVWAIIKKKNLLPEQEVFFW